MSAWIDAPDNLWQRLKARSRRLQLADAHVDQTHVHHALITCAVGIVLGFVAQRWLAPLWGARLGFDAPAWFAGDAAYQAGTGAMLGWYVYREWLTWRPRAILFNLRLMRAKQMHGRVDVRWWDGTCDVVVPMWLTMPLAHQSYAWLLATTAAVFVLYFVLRPVDDVPADVAAIDERAAARMVVLNGPLAGKMLNDDEVVAQLRASGHMGKGVYLPSVARGGYSWWPSNLGGPSDAQG